MEITRSATREKPPLVTPEQSLALQTYEYFNGGSGRQNLLEDFTSGGSLELELDYPKLSSRIVDCHVDNLDRLAYQDDEDGLDATVEFRLAEAYFLKQAARLNDVPEADQATIDHFQEMNEQLYGAPDPEVVSQILRKLWQDILACRSPATEHLIDKLKNGFTFTAQTGEQLIVPALPEVEEGHDTLPALDGKIHDWLKNYLSGELASARQIFQEYFDQKPQPDADKVFLPEDVACLFEEAAASIGMEISVIRDESGTNLSWSSINRAVRVGMRRKSINSVDELLGFFAHEVYIHGQRSFNGADLDSKSLESGLFTLADKNEDPSYLGFEEGLATVVQKTISGKEMWNIASIGNYLNIALASLGWTPRQIFEVMSRVRMVIGADKESPQISPEVAKKAEEYTLTQLVRTFRATPADKVYKTSDGKTLHYAKDLAYAAGKVKAITFLNEIKCLPDDAKIAEWERLLVGHYDPTNHYHRELVESCLTNN